MLSKCTNPSCSASFNYLDDGRLFLVETEPTLDSCRVNAREYFWLCKECSTEMTLRLAPDGRVTATRLRETLRNGPQVAFASVSRENGRLLRSINLFERSICREDPENPAQEHATPYDHDGEQCDDIVAAVSSCPIPDCNCLVVSYRAAGSVPSGQSEDWEFICSRCGMEFTAAPSELLFQSVPKQWLSANTHFA